MSVETMKELFVDEPLLSTLLMRLTPHDLHFTYEDVDLIR